MEERIKIGVSSCLLGQKVRYDGGHKLDRFITETLGRHFDFLGVCPEVECGLPVPREALHLAGDPANPTLVTSRSGVDHTREMQEWAKRRAEELGDEGLSGFIFKSRSPSSGMQGVKVYGPSGIPSRKGIGIFARVFMDRFPVVPVEDEGRLNDPRIRENFIERVFAYRRWQQWATRNGTTEELIRFHTDHKLLILSHSTTHYTELGRLVANSGGRQGDLHGTYITLFMEGMRLFATPRKNTNVLHHIMGYFKKQLSADEKAELLELIGQYHSGYVPLIVPVSLLKHYVRKYDQAYLKRQYYLNPHPVELMLRNHA